MADQDIGEQTSAETRVAETAANTSPDYAVSRARTLARCGHCAEPEVLREAGDAARRGRDVAVIAAAGSGHELVFGEAIASTCHPGEGAQALVLTPTRDTALRCAMYLEHLREALSFRLTVWPAENVSAGADSAEPLDIAIGAPADLLRSIRAGRLPTDGVRLLCVDAADVLLALGEWPAVEALLDTSGAEVGKLIASGEYVGPLQELLDLRLSRARRWPESLFETDDPLSTGTDGRERVVRRISAAREEDRLDLLASALREAVDPGRGRAVISCACEAAASELSAGLSIRGIEVAAGPGSPGALVIAEGTTDTTPDDAEVVAARRTARVSAWYGPPDDLERLRGCLEVDAEAVAAIHDREIAQLELMARRAGWAIRPFGEPSARADTRVARFRRSVGDKARDADLSAERVLLEPLLEEYGATTVAAALAALYRERVDRTGPSEPEERETAVLPAWTRLFMNVGRRDGAGPGDIVGAITGETGAAGAQVGRIDIRPTFSLVEVDSEIADRVIERLRSVRIKGRDVVIRRDRESSRSAR